jgi:hypothetical protein
MELLRTPANCEQSGAPRATLSGADSPVNKPNSGLAVAWIAPRRSGVRVPLAPLREPLQRRGFSRSLPDRGRWDFWLREPGKAPDVPKLPRFSGISWTKSRPGVHRSSPRMRSKLAASESPARWTGEPPLRRQADAAPTPGPDVIRELTDVAVSVPTREWPVPTAYSHPHPLRRLSVASRWMAMDPAPGRVPRLASRLDRDPRKHARSPAG